VIVVDANVLLYLLIPGKHTADAERWLEHDPDWAVPRLWRSEVRNVLATYLRAGRIEQAEALALFQRAVLIIGLEEYEVETVEVLRLAQASGCSAYDCEYVALAQFLDVPLVTADRKLRLAFPGCTLALDDG
jgi:predicted nucleic acid-binding protein